MKQAAKLVVALSLIVPLSGCLGTMVRAPTAAGRIQSTTRAHILAAPTVIDAHTCPNGIAEVFTFVPVWGVAVGILTFGIVVPMTTNMSCVPVRG